MQQRPTPKAPGIVSIPKEIRLQLDLSRVLLPDDGSIQAESYLEQDDRFVLTLPLQTQR
jgi:hypothetical protein